MSGGRVLAAVRPHPWRCEADPFWLIMGGGNGTCDAVIDVFKDPAQIGMTVRVKLNDPATPLAFVEYQVPAHDLRAFAQFVLRKLREAQP